MNRHMIVVQQLFTAIYVHMLHVKSYVFKITEITVIQNILLEY